MIATVKLLRLNRVIAQGTLEVTKEALQTDSVQTIMQYLFCAEKAINSDGSLRCHIEVKTEVKTKDCKGPWHKAVPEYQKSGPCNLCGETA